MPICAYVALHQAFDVGVGFDDYNHVFYDNIPPLLSVSKNYSVECLLPAP